MDALISSMVEFITNNNGSVSWNALMESVDPSQRYQVPQALQVAKKRQLLKRVLRAGTDGQPNSHTVELWGNE